GLAEQIEILEIVLESGEYPIVLDARELLRDPPGVLRRVCGALGMSFEEAMLSWPAGPKPEDGAWAKYWYENVHDSTGFGPYAPKTAPFPEKLKPLLEECRPLYERLRGYAIVGGSVR
ncbi:MAG: sulfotransferase family protein, partial [Rubrobacteraceae bacterium]